MASKSDTINIVGFGQNDPRIDISAVSSPVINISASNDEEQISLSMKTGDTVLPVSFIDRSKDINLNVGQFAGYVTIGGDGGSGVSDYNELDNLPSLNGVTIAGSRTSADYNIILSDTTSGWNSHSSIISKKDTIYVYTDFTASDGTVKPGIKIGDGTSYLIDLPFANEDNVIYSYLDLTNLPKINNVTVSGNKTIADYGIVVQNTTNGWTNAGTAKSKEGVVYVYTDYTTIDGVVHPGIKIGDGINKISDLPFVFGNKNAGSGGVSDYNNLSNRPSINGVIVSGNRTSADYNIVLSDTTANWDAQRTLVSKENTLYVYRDFKTINNGDGTFSIFPGIKIGDGTSYLIDMPFADGEDPRLIAHINNNTIHVTAAEKDFWNNKWRGYMTTSSPENLVFTTN